MGSAKEPVCSSNHAFVECGSPRIGYASISISFVAFFLGWLTSLPTHLHLPETIVVSK